MKKVILLATMLVLCMYGTGQTMTPRQFMNIKYYKFKEKKNKVISPYGEIKYIRTKKYQNAYMNIYKIVDEKGKKIIGMYGYMLDEKGKDNFLILNIYDNMYDENFKMMETNDEISESATGIMITEINNELMREYNKLN